MRTLFMDLYQTKSYINFQGLVCKTIYHTSVVDEVDDAWAKL